MLYSLFFIALLLLSCCGVRVLVETRSPQLLLISNANLNMFLSTLVNVNLSYLHWQLVPVCWDSHVTDATT
jgi:hypothetical protein